jgi:hypothetical protein
MKGQIGRGFLVVLGVAALAACAASAPPVSPPRPAYTSESDPGNIAPDKSKVDDNAIPGGARRVVKNDTEYFCVTETLTGSRTIKSETCRTRAQWAAVQDKSRDMMFKVQGGIGQRGDPRGSGPMN